MARRLIFGPDADLRMVSYPNGNLAGKNLARSNLSGANLQGCNLRGADLSGANLRGASLHGANLGGARLVDANLERCSMRAANLSAADLTRANLDCTDLRDAILRRTTFLQVRHLEYARLDLTKLSDAQLRESRLGEKISVDSHHPVVASVDNLFRRSSSYSVARIGLWASPAVRLGRSIQDSKFAKGSVAIVVTVCRFAELVLEWFSRRVRPRERIASVSPFVIGWIRLRLKSIDISRAIPQWIRRKSTREVLVVGLLLAIIAIPVFNLDEKAKDVYELFDKDPTGNYQGECPPSFWPQKYVDRDGDGWGSCSEQRPSQLPAGWGAWENECNGGDECGYMGYSYESRDVGSGGDSSWYWDEPDYDPCIGDCFDMDNDGRTFDDVDGDGDGRYESDK